jgi:Protein of unknown function (DUF3102)
MTNARPLHTIEGDLLTAMRAESANCITIGRLLIEAQTQLDHGQFIAWLEQHCDKSPATAYNYMGAAQFAAKFPTVGNLRLRPTAIYLLAQWDNNEGGIDEELREIVFKEAADNWIAAGRLHAMATEFYDARRRAALAEAEKRQAGREADFDEEETEETRKARQAREARERYLEELEAAKTAIAAKKAAAAEAELRKAVEAILDGPPPQLPPLQAPEEMPDKDIALFSTGLSMLMTCSTKPLAKFAATTHEFSDIQSVAFFLLDVADRKNTAGTQTEEVTT